MARGKKFGPVLPPAMKAVRAAARKAAKAPKTKKAVTALVKQVIARQEETKFRSQLMDDRRFYNSQIQFGDITYCLPKLVQDQGEGAIYERLGRKISVRGCSYHMDIALTDVTRSTNIIVHVWILENKVIKGLNRLDSTNTPLDTKFLLTGDSSETQGFNGYSQDSMLPVNNSTFKVLHHRQFYLGKNSGTVQDDSTAGNQPVFAAGNVRKRLTFKLPCPKVLMYEQDNNTPRTVYYPTNFAPFAVVGYSHANLTSPDTVNSDVSVTSRANLWYDDA